MGCFWGNFKRVYPCCCYGNHFHTILHCAIQSNLQRFYLKSSFLVFFFRSLLVDLMLLLFEGDRYSILIFISESMLLRLGLSSLFNIQLSFQFERCSFGTLVSLCMYFFFLHFLIVVESFSLGRAGVLVERGMHLVF